MSRILEISLPADESGPLLAEIQSIDGVIGIRLQREVALQPPGDVLQVSGTTDAVVEIMKVIDRRRLPGRDDVVISISSPDATVSRPHNKAIRNDFSDATWEEMECEVAAESNMAINALWVMGIAGVLAAVGISTNSIHVVIGAMVIAPGFEPILRIPLALVSGGPSWRKGLVDTLKGYGALMAGAALTTWLLDLPRSLSRSQPTDYLEPGILVTYWTTLSLSSLVVTGVAAVAGALIIAMKRSLLTAGVMIALALIPTASLTAMALVVGNYDVMGKAAVRWSVDAAAILVAGLLVFLWKRLRVQRRSTWL